ncbi:MAG: DUF2147 domain-containing protein [Rhizomicrobium sp.]
MSVAQTAFARASAARTPARLAVLRRAAGFVLLALLAAAPARAASPTPVGVWLHDNKRIKIEIKPCGERLCAAIVWFMWPNDAQGLPLVDLKNKDPALRGRPLLGLTVLRDLRRTGDNSWEDGRIYNPDDGEDYAATMSIQDDGTLRIRAYVLIPLFGHTFVWTRER